MNKQRLNIAVLPGDGIGVEVMHACLPVFSLLDIPVELRFGDIGWRYWESEGTPIPTRTWELIAETDMVLLGATTSKPAREAEQALSAKYHSLQRPYVSPIIQLRQTLDLFASVRPCFSIKEDGRAFDFCIIRENTEGLYAGFDYTPLPASLHQLVTEDSRWQDSFPDEMSCALRLQTKAGLMRLFRFAFTYAARQGMARVTFADKPNVLRQSGRFARALFEQVARDFPLLQADIVNVDAVALGIVRRPEQFGVIVAENMFGDILSDVGAGIMGGLGFAPSANIGQKGCYFEPVHGSAPQMRSNHANPSAMFLTISMLLKHFAYFEEANKILAAVTHVVNEGRFVTYDVGGKASTQEMAAAILDCCSRCFTGTKRAADSKQQESVSWQDLYALSTAEISDALDACGIEGALLSIKPLVAGIKLVGPAYTIKYLPSQQAANTFKNAANYIDEVPENAVIVIDNEGRRDCTVWGEILTRVALVKGIAGTVIHGAVRDTAYLREAHYPLYCTDMTMRSGKNRIHKVSEQQPLTINAVRINPGDIVVADDNGVLVIPLLMLQEVIAKAHQIKATENHIIAAVTAGSTLRQARADFRYDMPWLDTK